jgi:hypothetical protein
MRINFEGLFTLAIALVLAYYSRQLMSQARRQLGA